MPYVSIITPLYNGAAHIQDCIRSVQAQSFRDYEHLIIDNNSSDTGPDLVRQAAAADHRIKLLSQAGTKGAGPTRNAGISAAQGRLIAFLDCDDLWRSEKLTIQVNEMERRGLAFSWTSYGVVTAEKLPVRVQRADTSITYEDLLYKRTTIGCLTAIYDAKALGKHYMNHLPMRQDFCLWLDVIKTADDFGLTYGGIDAVLADYRAGGMTANKMKAAKMQWRAYREHAGLGKTQTMLAFASYASRAVATRMRPKRPVV